MADAGARFFGDTANSNSAVSSVYNRSAIFTSNPQVSERNDFNSLIKKTADTANSIVRTAHTLAAHNTNGNSAYLNTMSFLAGQLSNDLQKHNGEQVFLNDSEVRSAVANFQEEQDNNNLSSRSPSSSTSFGT